MYALLKAEFIRHRRWAILALLLQLGIWIFASRFGPVLEISGAMRSLSYLAIVLLCFGFGALQMYLHRRQNDWVFLIQRPLAPARIYLALASAGFALIAIAIPLAWVLFVAGLDTLTSGVVDVRHYLHGLFSFCAALCAYLLGSLVISSASRGAVLLIGLLTVVVTNISASTPLAFFIASLAIGLLLYLNAKSFLPDPKRHLSDAPSITLMSVSMQFGIVFMLVLSTSIFYHAPRFVIGNHPDNNPKQGTYSYFWRLNESQRIAYLLKDSDAPDAKSLIRQAELADYERLHTSPERFAERGQLHFLDEQSSLLHEQSNTRWSFSHDQMLLQGNHMITGEVIGFMGRNGFILPDSEANAADRFISVPFLVGERYLQTREALFEIDFRDRILSTKFALPNDDQFVTRPEFREHFAALTSNEHLYLFDIEQFAEVQSTALPDYVIEHPDMFSHGAFVELYRMVDGYLIVYHSAHYRNFDEPGADVLYASLDGEIDLLHSVPFPVSIHPAPIAHFDFLLSPLLHVAKQQLYSLIRLENHATSTGFGALDFPAQSSVYVTLSILFLGSIIAVLVLGKRLALGRTKTILWTALALLFGLPAFISFLLMNKLRFKSLGAKNP